MEVIKIHTDGGSRGNPGPAAIGIHIEFADKEWKHGETIGDTTNNVAEYTAVEKALELVEPVADECGCSEVVFYLDSELVVKQLTGVYRIKDQNLAQIAQRIKAIIAAEEYTVTFNHVRREQNKEADRLVNAALDNQL